MVAVLVTFVLMRSRVAAYRVRLEERDRQLKEQRHLLDPHGGQLKRVLGELLGGDFERLAHRVIDQKTRAFSEQSDHSLKQLLEPFREQLTDFKKQHEAYHHRSTREQQQLLDRITQTQEMNRQLSEQAEQLTRALRGDSKVQGDWGEVTLQRILEQLGLTKGREYDTQVSIAGGDGESALRADVVLRLPQSRVAIIDAKVSLTAYTRLVSATTDEERLRAEAEHAKSMRTHVRELGRKRYPHYWKLQHPESNVEDYLCMFVPIEGAIESAFRADPSLREYAREQRVTILNSTIMIVLLEALKNMWRVERQDRNTAKIYIAAGQIYEKCANFVESMEQIGKYLRRTGQEYEKAVGQLHQGRGSLISSTEKLKELGVNTKKEIPDHSPRELL